MVKNSTVRDIIRKFAVCEYHSRCPPLTQTVHANVCSTMRAEESTTRTPTLNLTRSDKRRASATASAPLVVANDRSLRADHSTGRELRASGINSAFSLSIAARKKKDAAGPRPIIAVAVARGFEVDGTGAGDGERVTDGFVAVGRRRGRCRLAL